MPSIFRKAKNSYALRRSRSAATLKNAFCLCLVICLDGLRVPQNVVQLDPLAAALEPNVCTALPSFADAMPSKQGRTGGSGGAEQGVRAFVIEAAELGCISLDDKLLSRLDILCG